LPPETVKENKDSVIVPNTQDSLNVNLNPNIDSLNLNKTPEVKKLSPEDSLLLAIHIEDSIKMVKQMAKVDAYFQMSELFLYDLGKPDSAIFYLEKIIDDSLSADRTSRALYSIATIYKNLGDEAKADDYYKMVVSRYPNSPFSNEARKVLGLQMVDIETDSSKVFYKSAEEYILKNNFESAVSKLKAVLNKNMTGDSLYVKSLYSLGWIYEYGYKNKDSSLYYYKKIRSEYPSSAFNSVLIPKIEFYSALDKIDSIKKSLKSMGTLSDSLRGIYDSLTYITDSTGWNINLTGSRNSNLVIDSSQVQPEKTKEKSKEKEKQSNQGEDPGAIEPKERK